MVCSNLFNHRTFNPDTLNHRIDKASSRITTSHHRQAPVSPSCKGRPDTYGAVAPMAVESFRHFTGKKEDTKTFIRLISEPID